MMLNKQPHSKITHFNSLSNATLHYKIIMNKFLSLLPFNYLSSQLVTVHYNRTFSSALLTNILVATQKINKEGVKLWFWWEVAAMDRGIFNRKKAEGGGQ